MSKQRIIDLQKQVKIARDALGKIANSEFGLSDREAHATAEQALDDMRRHDPAPSSAGLMGWEKRT